MSDTNTLIDADPDKVEELSKTIARTSLSLGGHMQGIYADLQRLMTTCEDERIDEFQEDFRRVRKPVEDLIDDLAMVHKELTALAEKYRKVQRSRHR